MYLPILHLPRVELRCKLQEKLHRVSGPLYIVPSQQTVSNNLVYRARVRSGQFLVDGVLD